MKNAKGFAAVETILVVVIIGMLAGIGWYVWDAHNKTNDTLNNADAANSSVIKQPKKPITSNSEDAAIKALTDYCTQNGNKGCIVNVTASQGDLVKASIHTSNTGPSYNVIAKKDATGHWSIIWQGQQTPTQADAAKYGLPADWGPYQ